MSMSSSPNRVHEHQKYDPEALEFNLPQNHPKYLRWTIEFILSLFDFSFSEVVTVRMLPLLYGLAMIATGVATFYLAAEIILSSLWHGTLFLLLVAPILFIFGIAVARTLLEFFSAVFRIQMLLLDMSTGIKQLEDKIDQLSIQIGQMDSNLKHMSNHMGSMQQNFHTVLNVLKEFEQLTDRIPFFKKPKRTATPPLNRYQEWAESPLSQRIETEIKK